MHRPTRPYRILITTWQDFGAGSVQSVQYLAEGLAARGHEVQVACPADGLLGRRLQKSGVPVIDFAFRRGWSLRSARSLRRVVESGGFELVDAQESRDRKAAILARSMGPGFPPLVITRRQMTHSSRLQNLVYSKAADRVVAISHGVARDLQARGMRGAAMRVVHTGLDPRRLEPMPEPGELEALREALGLRSDLPTIGVVARRKDQETLLRAVARLNRPVNVLFAGIERDSRLAAIEGQLPSSVRVAYAGFREDVRACWALLDVKVLTTVEEGLSQAILEGMWLGVPVLSAEAGGTPEVVRHGVNGFLFPPSDDEALAALLALVLDDAELRGRMTAEARRTVASRFLAEGLVERTEAVYAELLEEAPPSAGA